MLYIKAIEDVQEEEERTYGSFMMQRLTGSEDGRIDHMLQVSKLCIQWEFLR